MPLVVEAVRIERPLRGRAEPETVIDARGHRPVRLVADRRPVPADIRPRVRHLAELAGLDELVGALVNRAASPLRADLDDAVVLAGRLDHLAAFDQVVRDRLLDVNVLAGLAGPDGTEGVPVVGGGDHDRGHGRVFEHSADVLLGLRLLLAGVAGGLHRRRDDVLVRVDDVRDLDVVELGEAAE